ncbi:MAG: hypothetical protein QM740_00715 [Acidovorax sp.]
MIGKNTLLWRLSVGLLIGFCVLTTVSADELESRYEHLWRPTAFLCEAWKDGVKFPSRPTGEAKQPCDDGDMTLFNGLLCASGEALGCLGVKEALDRDSGQWHRSPRIRVNGNDRGGASFSPDMALGVQLYLVTTKDVDSGWKWLMWLHNHVPCWVVIGGTCIVQAPIPRFCTDLPKEGEKENFECTLRPGDSAALSSTVSWLQKNAGLSELPNGSLRGNLGTFSGKMPSLLEAAALVNRPGFSQHLVAVGILLERLQGTKEIALDIAANTLATREPNNAFFKWLAEGPTQAVRDLILARCPASDRLPEPPLHQWQWEREDADNAWLHSCYWDCIFMYRLLKVS